MTGRLARSLLVVSGVVVIGVGGVVGYREIAAQRVAKKMNRIAAPLLQDLWDSPEDVPPESTPPGAITSVSGRFTLGKAPRIAPIRASTRTAPLRFDRALAGTRSSPPPFWLLVFDENADKVTYWVPLDDPRRARAEPGGPVMLQEAVFSVRVPAQPHGWAAIFKADPSDRSPLMEFRRFPRGPGNPASGMAP